ncbi:MAG: hypothetical protein ABGY09_00205, partial [Euryarchaeota archaeon]
MEVVLELSMGRYRAGDVLERTRCSLPAQTLFGAILGATVELLRGHGEDPGTVRGIVEGLIEGLELSDAFPVSEDGKPLLPVPEHLHRLLSDPEWYGQVLREFEKEGRRGDGEGEGRERVKPETHELAREPEHVPLSLFLDLCVEAVEPTTMKKKLSRLFGDDGVRPAVGRAQVTHASVPRTGEDTTPFTADYASGGAVEGPTHVAFLRFEGEL